MAADLEIDLNLLLALGALLEDRNLTRAGERIGMSQPAMSAALARLRRHFADDLLEREGRGYKRTVSRRAAAASTVRTRCAQLEATMQRSPRFDPAESGREFSIAASDYAVTILADPLLRLVKRTAPRIRLNLHPLPASLPSSSQVLSTEDLLIGPVGYDFPGSHAELFRDRFVCVVDASNPRLRDGRLTLDDLSRMPHAAPTFAPGSRTPVDRVLDELGVTPRVRVTVFGWLSVPFVARRDGDGGDHARADGAPCGPRRAAGDTGAAVRPRGTGRGRLLAPEQDRRPRGPAGCCAPCGKPPANSYPGSGSAAEQPPHPQGEQQPEPGVRSR